MTAVLFGCLFPSCFACWLRWKLVSWLVLYGRATTEAASGGTPRTGPHVCLDFLFFFAPTCACCLSVVPRVVRRWSRTSCGNSTRGVNICCNIGGLVLRDRGHRVDIHWLLSPARSTAARKNKIHLARKRRGRDVYRTISSYLSERDISLS
jgi:hypothetical protein